MSSKVLGRETAKDAIQRDEEANSHLTALVLSTIRCLAGDLAQQFKGGHAGTPMGAAALGIALFKHAMVFDPLEPTWLNRDRFVLSAGHACLLQYMMLHLCGYKGWPLEELKRYHSRDFVGSKAAGHPEREPEHGIEITTGPLGQGIANAVGMAIASKNLAATYNQPDLPLVDNTIWAFTGDGCIQEGVGMEAISLAGHLGLDNLVLVYDDNQVTVDGTCANCFTDDTAAKFRAQNWHVLQVPAEEGTHDVEAIAKALQKARSRQQGQPVLVIVRTTIGFGSRKANTGPVHGQALGEEEVAYVKQAFGMDPKEHFVISEEVYRYFDNVKAKGAKARREWMELAHGYAKKHPVLWQDFDRRMHGGGRLPRGWQEELPPKDQLPSAAQPTRKSSGIVIQTLAPRYNDFMVGSADLLESTFVSWKDMVEFQSPATGLGTYAGRQIRYGIREHAMLAIANGMTAYADGAIIPICSTFYMFYLYAAPAIRMSALQHLRFIGVATHDSIGIGEDGPTHQPIALSAFFRALPNILLFRPADAEEVMGCWMHALETPETPSVISLSRQPVPLQAGSDRKLVSQGAYTIWPSTSDHTDHELVVIATGAEVAIAVQAAEQLSSSGLSVRVVSMPCMALFDHQPVAYKRSVLPVNGETLIVAVEAWTSFGWARYAHASLSMHTFGLSGPQADLFEHFGFGVDSVVEHLQSFVSSRRDPKTKALRIPGVGEFEELSPFAKRPHAHTNGISNGVH